MSKKCCQLKNLHPSIVHLVEGVKSHPNLAAGELPKPPFPLHLKVQRRRMWHDQKKLPAQPHQPFGCCNRCIAPSSKIREQSYSRAASARTRSWRMITAFPCLSLAQCSSSLTEMHGRR